MEAFSLLKYWKGSSAGGRVRVAGGGEGAGTEGFPVSSGGNGKTTTILAAVEDHAGDLDSDSDEGPFFDLEFAVPADEDVIQKLERENSEIVDDEEEDIEDDDDGEEVIGGERELKLRPSSSTSSCENSEPNVSLSPSDEVLLKGRIVHIDGSEDEEVNSKSGQFPMSASLLRSATKFRVLMLKLKRTKSESPNITTKSQPLKQNQQNRKLFTVKFKVEEVPVISLLSRASSNSKTNSTTATAVEEHPVTSASDSGDEKRNNKKETMQKYLKLVKPLYIRVSKRNQPPVRASETKEKMAEETSAEEEVKEETAKVTEAAAVEKSDVKMQKAVVGLNLKGMMMAKKHLGKSKSAVVHSHTQSIMQNVGSKKRDDSLVQQQDWIQGAILHCKRSFNSSISDLDVEEKEEGSVLTRSASDPSHEKKRTATATELTRMGEKENNVDVVVD